MHRFFEHIILLLLLISICSCKPIYQTQTFKTNQVPKAPNYNLETSWAVLPWTYTEELQTLASKDQDTLIADVFYVYPTLFLDKKTHDGMFLLTILHKIKMY